MLRSPPMWIVRARAMAGALALPLAVACTGGSFGLLTDAGTRADRSIDDADSGRHDASLDSRASADAPSLADATREDASDAPKPADARASADVGSVDAHVSGDTGVDAGFDAGRGPDFCAVVTQEAPGGAYVLCDDFDEDAGVFVPSARGSATALVESQVHDTPPNALRATATPADGGSTWAYVAAQTAPGAYYSLQLDFSVDQLDVTGSATTLLADIVAGSASNAAQVGVLLVPGTDGNVKALQVFESEPSGTGSTNPAHAPVNVTLPSSGFSRVRLEVYANGAVWQDTLTLNPSSDTPQILETTQLSGSFAGGGFPIFKVGLVSLTGGGARTVTVDDVLVESLNQYQ